MKVRELLKLLDNTSIEDRKAGCYKRLHLKTVQLFGEIIEHEYDYNKYTEISNTILDLNVVSLERINTHKFAFSYGLDIYLLAIDGA